MKLTNQNIQSLYKFTRQHFVEHYDVQTELVDHLANDIEQIWEEKPNLTFREARDISFKKFGVFGFMNVVEQKQKQMNKKYFKIIIGFVKEWLKLPRIILTISLVYLFFILQKVPHAYFIFIGLYGVVFTTEIIMLIRRKKRLKKKFMISGKKWMFEEIIESQGYLNIAFFTYYLFYFISPENYNEISLFRSLIISIAITLAIIVGYISLYIIPKKAEKLLEEHYPEYKIV